MRKPKADNAASSLYIIIKPAYPPLLGLREERQHISTYHRPLTNGLQYLTKSPSPPCPSRRLHPDPLYSFSQPSDRLPRCASALPPIPPWVAMIERSLVGRLAYLCCRCRRLTAVVAICWHLSAGLTAASRRLLTGVLAPGARDALRGSCRFARMASGLVERLRRSHSRWRSG